MSGLYKVIKGLITEKEALEISEAIKKSPKNDGDVQVPNSYSYYGLPVCNILLGQLLERASELSGKKLKPAYTYCRVCFKGAELKAHKDRPSCEYSITLNISQSHPWPIYMGKRKVMQNPGDGVLYKGCEIEHSRPVFTGDEYAQIFLHYVDADGPHKDHIFDLKKDEVPKMYHFIFPDFFENHANYYRFISAIPHETIDNLVKLLDSKELIDGQVGDGGGTVNLSKRRAKIFWLPKTDEFLDIYTTILDLIIQCNREFYGFSLSQISEQIQYTVYNSDEQGHYDWHIDMGPGKSRRKLSLVCQLSDPSEYEGGELQINTGQILTTENEKGTVILFPSYLLHRVTPVTKGTRRSLVLWIDGPSFI